MGGFRAFVLTCPILAQRVIQEQASSLRHGLGTGKMKKITGNGILTSEGERHQDHRKMLAPLFAQSRQFEWSAALESIVDRHLSRMAGEGAIDFGEAARDVAFEIVLKILFDASPSPGKDSIDRMIQALASSFATPFFRRRKFEKGAERIRSAIVREVAGHRGPLHAMFPDEMSDHEKAEHAISLFIAGTDTLGWAFAWTAALLARHPAWVEAEGMDRAIVEESLRLYPTVWLIARTAVSEVRLDADRLVPDRSRFIAPLTLLHRHPDHWERPDEFDPARFLSPCSRPRMAFAPFGVGAFSCIGQRLAMTALEAFVRRLNAGYRLSYQGSMPGTRGHITLTSDRPILVRVSRVSCKTGAIDSGVGLVKGDVNTPSGSGSIPT